MPTDGLTAELAELRQRRSYKWRSHPADVLPAHVAESDLPAPEPVQAVLAEMVARGDFGYAVPGDLPEVYADFAAWRYGQRLDPADVHLIGDVMQGLYATLRLLGRPGDGVVICPPVYHPFFADIPAAGARVVQVPLVRDGAGRYDLDLDGLRRAFAADGVRFFVLCHPHNPIGRVWTAAELTAVAELTARHGVTVIADEIHAPLVYDGVPFVPYGSIAPGAITLVSASKAFNLAGLKAALAVTGSPELRARWQAAPELIQIAASVFGVAASRAALAEGRDWLDDTVRRLQANRDTVGELVAGWPGLAWSPPEATFLAWLDCRAAGLGEEPAARLLERVRVAVEPGERFGLAGRGYIRLNFATSPTVLGELLGRLRAASSR